MNVAVGSQTLSALLYNVARELSAQHFNVQSAWQFKSREWSYRNTGMEAQVFVTTL